MYLKLIIYREKFCAEGTNTRDWQPAFTDYSLARDCEGYIQLLEKLPPNTRLNEFIGQPDNTYHFNRTYYKRTLNYSYGDYYYECDRHIAKKLSENMPFFRSSFNNEDTILSALQQAEAQIAKENRLWGAKALVKQSIFNPEFSKDLVKKVLSYVCDEERELYKNDKDKLLTISENEDRFLDSLKIKALNKLKY